MVKYETQIENYGEEGDIIVVDAKKLDKLLLHIGASETELYEDNEDTPIFDEVPDGTYYILQAIGSEVIENGLTKQARAFLKLTTKDYHDKKSDILWEYISDKDIPEIQKRLEELEK